MLFTCLQIQIVNTEIKSAIIKADISDPFPILFVAEVNVDVNIKTEHILICDKIKIFDSVNHSNNSFLQFFLLLYNNVLLG